MLWLAAIVEWTIKNYDDMGVLIGIQFANASLSYYETVKADDAVAALRVERRW
jgi:H+-transporting ATPase